MQRRVLMFSAAFLGVTAFTTTFANALPSCGDLGSNPAYGLAGNAKVSALSAVNVAATATVPAFCQVDFTYSDVPGQNIKLRVGLPLPGAWNGRLRSLGGGGYVGSVGSVTASIQEGYVGSSTDSGHVGGSGSFVLNPDNSLNVRLLQDFSKDAVRWQTIWSKALIKTYYGTPAVKSYWTGCSKGGQQAMKEVQKYPNDYDGVLAMAPAVNWDRFFPGMLYPAVAWNNDIGAPIPMAKINAATSAAITACDALDGVVDGSLEDPRKCNYDAAAFVCTGGPGDPANCLTAQEAVALNKMWDGPRNASNKKVWFGYERVTGALSATAGAAPVFFGSDHHKFWIKQDPAFDWQTVDYVSFVDDFVTSELKFQNYIGTDQPDLTKFRDNGGKLLMWHGWADQLIHPRGSINYYNRVADVMGGYAGVTPWFRLFMAPGVLHCAGGEGPQVGNNLWIALVNWVENGVAPDQIIATKASPARTRPLCPYPSFATYSGSGSTDDAASFNCVGTADDPALLAKDILAKRFHAND